MNLMNSYRQNTLSYDVSKCIGCDRCSTVCPHGVFVLVEKRANIARYEACMECGACALNCPTGAISVESGTGCAAAMIRATLTGQDEVRCG